MGDVRLMGGNISLKSTTIEKKGLMLEFSLTTGGGADMKQWEIDFQNLPTAIASARTDRSGHHSENPRREFGGHLCIRLNLADLKYFEVVERQFEPWGVIFANAMAINPSNPAFLPRSGSIVLLGAPRNGSIEATFSQPVHFVRGCVTSSRSTVLTAYDCTGREIARDRLFGANLAGSSSPVAPNTELKVAAEEITKIKFYAFDGQLTLDDFSFSF